MHKEILRRHESKSGCCSRGSVPSNMRLTSSSNPENRRTSGLLISTWSAMKALPRILND